MVMGMILFSIGVSYAYTFIIEPVHPDAVTIPTEFWRWTTTGLLSLIAVMLRFGWKAITKEFANIGVRMDGFREDIHDIKRSQVDFALGVTQLALELHPEKAVVINERLAELLKQRSHREAED